MGYRELLKRYMTELRAAFDSDYVEELASKERFSKRELGELRTISAELNRERVTDTNKQDSG